MSAVAVPLDLKIARGFALPLDLVTEATAIVATRGAGKSSASAVIVEEGFAAGAASLTAAGRDVSHYPTGRPTDRELQEAIYAQVGGKAAEILRLLVAENGEWVTVDDLAERMGYHPRSKGFTNNLSRLSGLDLADREPGRVRASALCFLP